MAAKGKNKFVEAIRAIRKGKAIAGTFNPPPKRAQRAKEIVMLPPPPLPPTTEEQIVSQLESSSRGILQYRSTKSNHNKKRLELEPYGPWASNT